MAENVSNVSFRIDSDLKAQADALFAALGLNMTTAFGAFSVISNGMHPCLTD